MSEERFYFGRDNSGHWYLVPDAHREEFERWSGLDDNDEEGWEHPIWAKRLNVHISQVVFIDPVEV